MAVVTVDRDHSSFCHLARKKVFLPVCTNQEVALILAFGVVQGVADPPRVAAVSQGLITATLAAA